MNCSRTAALAHIEATFTAALLGLALSIRWDRVGVVPAVAASRRVEPVICSTPFRAWCWRLFVIWLGIDLASKVALAFILVAWHLLHGVQRHPAGRPQLVERIVTLGGGRWDLVRHVPAVGVAWAWQPQDRSWLCSPAPVSAFVSRQPRAGLSASFARALKLRPDVRLIFLIMVVVLLIFAIAGRVKASAAELRKLT